MAWLQSIQMTVNWCPTSTRRWFGNDCLATKSHQELLLLPESAPAGQEAPGGSSGHPLKEPGASYHLPPRRCPGVITGHYGLRPVSRAGRNKPSGHLYYWGWPLILSGFGHLPEGRVRLPRSCQPIPSRTFSIDLLLLKGALTSSNYSAPKGKNSRLIFFTCHFLKT